MYGMSSYRALDLTPVQRCKRALVTDL